MHFLAKISLSLCLTTFSLTGGTGCAGLINAAATKNVARDVRTGSSRETVMRSLGSPRQTLRFAPPTAGSAFPDAPLSMQREKVAICDDYRVSGLLVTQINDDSKEWSQGYPWAVLGTAGLDELIFIPVTVANLSVRGVRQYHLRLWYDPAGLLIGESRRLEPLPPPPSR